MRWQLAAVTAAVAVTVVILLAALLIAWIGHPSQSLSTPPQCGGCGSPFALSPATEEGQPGEWWYNFSIQSAPVAITLGDLAFQVQSANGRSVALGNATLLVFYGLEPDIGTYSFATNEWASGGSTNVTTQMDFSVQCGLDLRHQGDTFVTLGTSGAGAGEVTTSIP